MTILNSSDPSPAPPDGEASSRSSASSARLKLRAQQGDGCVVVALWGELYADSAGDLMRLAHGLMSEECNHFVLDVSRLYDLDSEAIAELGRLRTTLLARQGSLSLAAPRPWVSRVLESTCRRGAFPVFATVADAKAGICVRPAQNLSARS